MIVLLFLAALRVVPIELFIQFDSSTSASECFTSVNAMMKWLSVCVCGTFCADDAASVQCESRDDDDARTR